MIRLTGITMIAAAVFFLGVQKSFLMKKRIASLYQFKTVLHMLRGEIAFSGRILEEALLDISERCGEPFDRFFREISRKMKTERDRSFSEIWEEAEPLLEGSGMEEEELLLLRKMGKELGFLDMEMQLNTISLVETGLEPIIGKLEQNKDSFCKMYQSLGILGAMAVMIVMI